MLAVKENRMQTKQHTLLPKKQAADHKSGPQFAGVLPTSANFGQRYLGNSHVQTTYHASGPVIQRN